MQTPVAFNADAERPWAQTTIAIMWTVLAMLTLFVCSGAVVLLWL
jgi:hypothetical protein